MFTREAGEVQFGSLELAYVYNRLQYAADFPNPKIRCRRLMYGVFDPFVVKHWEVSESVHLVLDRLFHPQCLPENSDKYEVLRGILGELHCPQVILSSCRDAYHWILSDTLYGLMYNVLDYKDTQVTHFIFDFQHIDHARAKRMLRKANRDRPGIVLELRELRRG